MPRRATSTSFGGKAGNKRNTTIPGPGRPPDVFRNKMALIAARAKTVQNIEKILDDPKHPSFMKALEFAADRGFGKAPQAVELSGEVKHEVRGHVSWGDVEIPL